MNFNRAILTALGFMIGGLIVYYTIGILWGSILGTMLIMFYVIIMAVGTRTTLFVYIAIILDIGLISVALYNVGSTIPADSAAFTYGAVHYGITALLFITQLMFNRAV